MPWTDFGTRKVVPYKFNYTPGDTVNAFTMVGVDGWLMVSKIATNADATPVDGVAHEDWEILGYINLVENFVSERVVIARGTDYTNQEPSATDTPLQVTFGTGLTPGENHATPSDPVNINTDGSININQADNYHLRLSSQQGRSGTGGTAWLWQRVLVNGVQAGVSVLVKLKDQNTSFPYQAELTADLPAGAIVTVELWRGSEGANDGGYLVFDPLLASANPGFSSDIIVSRYEIQGA